MNRSFIIISGSLILLSVFSGAIFAQSQSDEASADTSKGTITGRVVDQNGQPLANALVGAHSYGSTSRGSTTTTDREGNFQIGGLDPFAYIVTATLPTYIPAPRDPDATPIGFYRVGDSAQIQLIKGGVITGSVKR